ncbi:MAG: LysE family translocator [Pseudomonadota bacterium]
MDLETWIAFTLASIAIIVVPGPVVFLTITRAAARGPRAAIPLALGSVLGDGFAMTASLMGAGALLTASAGAFNILKILGALYLIWLGIDTFRRRPRAASSELSEHGTSFRSAFLVTALHPGGFVFFIAFVPLFVDQASPILLQLILMQMTFLGIAAVNVIFWALVAGTVRDRLNRPAMAGALKRIAGSVLIATGVAALFAPVPQDR